ncbi:MAG TPA: superoxide dismutase, Ni, partial [Candidatus Poseidoniaceae archaeon]
PDLHDIFWQAAKLCSACKVEVSAQHAQELMDAVEKIHHLFWSAKGRDVPWVRAS